MAAAIPVISAATGVLGLLQASNAQKQQGRYINSAIAAQQPQIAAQNQILQNAEAYDPAQQDKLAFSAANQNAGQTLSSQLGSMLGNFTQGGGQPAGDTAFNLASQGAANRVMDPLRMWAAQQVALEPQKKADALSAVFRAPAGQISDTYFNAAKFAGGNADPSGSINALVNALSKMGQPAVGPGGTAAGPVYGNQVLPGSTQGPTGVWQLPQDPFALGG